MQVGTKFIVEVGSNLFFGAIDRPLPGLAVIEDHRHNDRRQQERAQNKSLH